MDLATADGNALTPPQTGKRQTILMKHSQRILLLTLAAALLLFTLAACNAAPAVPTVAPSPAAPTAVEPAATQETATTEPTPAPEPTSTPVPTAAPAATEPATEPTPTAAPSLVAALLAGFPGQPQAAGEVVLLFGRVLDTNGDPVPGAAVEIWHTDDQGVYDHPGDRSTASRDRSFQFYGTSPTNADGVYAFRTITPGYYEPRPKHIHVKVRIDGQEALTTQFYFEEDRSTLASEGVFSQAGGLGELLVLKAVQDPSAVAAGVRVLTGDLGLNRGGGALTPTPAQTEGPYYPVVDVSTFDNDLTVVP